MKRILVLTLLLGVSIPVVGVGPTAAYAGEVIDVGNTSCPVSGDKVSPKASYVYQGKKYHFCCTGCIKKFQKNPEKYIAKLAAAEKTGKEDGTEKQEHASHEHHH